MTIPDATAIPNYSSLSELNRNLPNTVELIRTIEGDNVYIVGTAHFSLKSQDDVSLLIRNTQPHAVVLELCPLRLHILQYDEERLLEEATDLGPEKVRRILQEQGVTNGLFYLSFLRTNASITRQLGIAPGGECRRAVAEANQVPDCKVLLGDRPIDITLKRALSGLSMKQKLMISMAMYGPEVETTKITPEDVEKFKDRDREPLKAMEEAMPSVFKAFVTERDIILAHSLRLAAISERLQRAKLQAPRQSAPSPINVVGVVGMGHMKGIVKNFGRTTNKQVEELLRIPGRGYGGGFGDGFSTSAIVSYIRKLNWPRFVQYFRRK